ncbi:MAG: hypothetical protein ACRDL2_10305 [Gaiellaceae bacterium]
MRSVPKTPVAQLVWLVGVVALFLIVLGATWFGLALMAVAAVAGIGLGLAGYR